MSEPPSTPRRRYDRSLRYARSLETERRILQAAQACFERSGWSATTIPAVAAGASVSVKTIEARFGTKAALLSAVVDWVIRGDASDVPIAEREIVTEMRLASDARLFVELHAHLVRTVQERSARVQAAVENAAFENPTARELWHRLLTNRRAGTQAPARQLLTLPGHRCDLTLEHAATVFWLTTDWAYWRALHDQQGFSPDQIEAWTKQHYVATLL